MRINGTSPAFAGKKDVKNLIYALDNYSPGRLPGITNHKSMWGNLTKDEFKTKEVQEAFKRAEKNEIIPTNAFDLTKELIKNFFK